VSNCRLGLGLAELRFSFKDNIVIGLMRVLNFRSGHVQTADQGFVRLSLVLVLMTVFWLGLC